MTDYNKKFAPIFILLILFASSSKSWSQHAERWTSSEIHKQIKKLNFLGSALYFAAHPDDENTRLISFLASEVQADVAYLSLTRGDGGQNLIGTEIREGLGLIRTQELLQARRTDGGSQFFSTANDFGYSKNPSETFSIWDKEKVLSDATWIVRNFQPDIVINRFDHRTPGTTHGHHTSSAIVSTEVYDLAADSEAFEDQIKLVSTWQVKRLFFNTSPWFYGGQKAFEKADKTNLYEVNVGTYYPENGYSNNEIAAQSRSMHKSQGFGARQQRGDTDEYLELLEGKPSKDRGDLFAGINTTWSRVPGGSHITEMVSELIENYSIEYPENSLKELIALKKAIEALDDHHWKFKKLTELNQIITQAAGLYLSFETTESFASPGSEIKASLEIVSRSSELSFKGYKIQLETETGIKDFVTDLNESLDANSVYNEDLILELPMDMSRSNSYWLEQTPLKGNYQVDDYKKIGKPEEASVIQARFVLNIEGEDIFIDRGLKHRFVDPVRGEVMDPFHVVPELSVNFVESVVIFASEDAKTLSLNLRAGRSDLKGQLSLDIPQGWKITPEIIDFEISNKGEEISVEFEVTPPQNSQEAYLRVDYKNKNTTAVTEISYDHIPKQYMYLTATQKLARVKVETKGSKVAYIMGAGDEVPKAIEQLGYEVSLLESDQITLENLKKYDAVVLGIRALNVREDLRYKMQLIEKYVYQGGNVIVQYNTSRGVKVSDFSPYPISLSRDRVTVEESEVRILKPDHRSMNYPNKITSNDFEGWVQERGLYFPNEWDENYEAIFGANDPGEPSRNGGLLITKYGEGYYTYTGYSWFRELPAGVVGAYRIFANLLSLGYDEN